MGRAVAVRRRADRWPAPFRRTGLAEWLGGSLQAVGALPLIVIVVLAATLIIFLTELTSNIATTATFLPVVGAIAIEAGYDPIVLAVPVTMAASCAFMLPVATPPNAIVFGSGMLTIPRMARAGLVLNLDRHCPGIGRLPTRWRQYSLH